MTVTVDIGDRLAVVTINRPDVRNALSRQVLADLRAALASLRTDDKVGVVAVTGAGGAAFVAGADIAQLRGYTLHTGLDAEGPLAVRLAKLVVRVGMDTDLRTGLVVERLAQALLYTTDDKREGAAAFLDKRRPAFQGR
jgi:enoyl-CoA hydratase/carnithine racemase